MKPPVEAPTSRQRRPAGSSPSASSALRSLIAAARDVGRRRVDAELDVGLDELARLRGARVARAEAHLARHHRGRGARAGREQPALRQQGVEADPGHRRNATDCAPAHRHRRPRPATLESVTQNHLPPHPQRPRARSAASPCSRARSCSAPSPAGARRRVLPRRAGRRAGARRPGLPPPRRPPVVRPRRSSPPSAAAASGSRSPATRPAGLRARRRRRAAAHAGHADALGAGRDGPARAISAARAGAR